MKRAWQNFVVLTAAAAAWGQDPYDLVRRSIAQDQLDWVRMKDYTWQARSVEKHLDPRGNVESTKRETWETLMLDGQPYRRTLERDGKPLSPEEQRREQSRLDRETGRLSSESTAEKQRRMDEAEKRRRREFAFLSEIPELLGPRNWVHSPAWTANEKKRKTASARQSIVETNIAST